MKNKEKYAKEIFEIACSGSSIALDKNTMQPVSCAGFNCCNCSFRDDNGLCNELCAEWCESEYVEPPIDWSKVSVDTPILVKTFSNDEAWQKRHFAKYEDETVYAWCDGGTSWTEENMTSWRIAKLADENEGE